MSENPSQTPKPDVNYGEELILVVDDEESVRAPIVQMLKHLGFQANPAAHGQEALEELSNKPYTFMLTDIRMPGMDGLQLIQRVRGEFPHIYSIAMTGYSKDYKYIDVINAGATDFINKPFGLEELEAKVRRAILERNIRQELSRLSITDALTGLYNQRHFYARLQDEIRRAERRKDELSLILLDLDNFKRYNDTRGHLAGDELLHNVGEIITTNIRQGMDSGYRYGGDEFAIILVDAAEEVTRQIGERVGKAIEEECGLGATMGYAQFSKGMTPEAFVDRADKELYRLKSEKRMGNTA